MSEKKRRGISKCKKKLLHPGESTVDFDETGRAVGKNAARFMSWIGVEFKSRIPYNKVAKQVNRKEYEGIWEYAKETWKIEEDDVIKRVTLSKGKSIMRKFRYTLRKEYVYKDECDTPFETYDYLDSELWNSFVAVVDTEEWKEISRKAKNSAAHNIDPSHVGRCGFAGLEPHVETRWNQLVSSYPCLDVIQDDRSKMYTVSRARFNPVTKLYELGEDLVSNGELTGILKELYLKERQMRDDGSYSTKDVVTEVIGKGRQHGGRTRLFSDVIGPTKCLFSEIKTKKKKSVAGETTVGERPGMGDSSPTSGSSYTEILSIKKCQLLHPDDKGTPKVIGMGRVHPTPERIMHNCPMIDGFVKVQVDRIVEGCESISLLPESCIPGAVECLEDAKGSFIQWPIKSIKILNKDSSQIVEPSHHSMNTLYRPQFDATSAHQERTDPDERNEYQIYSYALQDEDAFNELLADKQFSQNTIQHVPFHKPTEFVHTCKPTEPVVVSGPSKEKTAAHKHFSQNTTENVPFHKPTEFVHAYKPTEPVVVSRPSKEKTAAHKHFSQNTTEHVPFYKPTESIHAYKPTEPVVPSKPSKEKTKILKLLEKARARPQSIYGLAQQVAIQSEKSLSMVFISPTGMYEERIEETVEFEAVIQLCVNGWADACFVHWFTMHLYSTGEREGLNNTAYFHPRYLEGDLVSDDGEFVIDHIRNVISFHKDKQWFMAPHIVGKHWLLVLLQHHPVYETWKGYIFDSRKNTKDASEYEITNLFEHAIKQQITWVKVNCRLQPNGWECGYCVMMAMYDFVICNREHMLINKTTMVRQGEINEFVERTLKVFISSLGHGEEVEEDE